MRYWIFLFAILAIASRSVLAADYTAAFPSAMSNLISPNGKYMVVNVDYDHRVPHHALFIVNESRKQRIYLYSYSRHVDISWALDSAHLYINDYAGSDNSDCLIYGVSNMSIVRIANVLQKYNLESSQIKHNGHVYIKCSKWISNKRVAVEVSGYGGGNPNGFNIYYVYELGKKPRPLKIRGTETDLRNRLMY